MVEDTRTAPGVPSVAAARERWVIDFEKKVFYRRFPRSKEFPLNDWRLVHDLVGPGEIEIHAEDIVLGPYRRIQE